MYILISDDIFIVCIRDGELLLVDSGCEYNGYSSDTTRVWPVNGKFTKVQKELYQVLLNIQKNCIKVKKENFYDDTSSLECIELLQKQRLHEFSRYKE